MHDLIQPDRSDTARIDLAVLDALPAGIAVLSAGGDIVCVNEAWRSRIGGAGRAGLYEGPGASYLSICDAAAAGGDQVLTAIAAGLRAVLAGAAPEFRLEYPDHLGEEQRWFLCTARPLRQGGLVIEHLPISDLKQMEQRVQRERQVAASAHEALCEAVETMSEGFALYDADDRLLFCNEHYDAFYRPVSQLVRSGTAFRDLTRAAAEAGLFPDAIGREDQWVDDTIRCLTAANGEMELRLAGNRWIRMRTRRTVKESLVCIVTDISELKRREASLQASEARFRHFAEAGSERFWEMDEELRFSYYSVPKGDDSGVLGDRLLGRTLWEVVTAEGTANEYWRRHCDELEAHLPFRDFRFSKSMPSGQISHYRTGGVPVFDDDGRFGGYRGVMADETEEVEARLRAERAEALLRAAVESVPYGFVIHDRDDRLVLCNSKYQELYRLSDEAIRTGVSFETAVREGLAEGRYLEALGREEEWLAERLEKHRHPTGAWEQRQGSAWILVEETPLPDGGTVGMRTDITEVKRNAERAIQSERLQALGTLAGGIAHDFNNLLAAMIGYTELLADEPDLGEEARDCVEQVLSAGQKAKDLVKQILRFSRFTDDGAAELCCLATVAGEVVSMLRPTIHPDIRLEVDVRSRCADVLAIPAHLSQIVMNLTVNAVQAIGRRKGRVEVRVDEVEVDEVFAAAHPPLAGGPCVRLVVRDDGPGMDEALLKRIFEPFFTTKQVGEGTGMGLSVVHGIVGKYDGMVTAYSEPGVGSEFHVYLPRATDAAGERRAVASTAAATAGGAGNALLVDDDPAVRGATAGLLSRLGYCIVEFSDAASALEGFREHPDDFALVVTDQVMPGMSGQELAMAIRETRPALPLLLCTGYGHGLDETRLAELGHTALLVKPFTLRELGATLDGLVGAARSC
ncbi:Signal transduction histidine kinase [Tistlia consotensis]|uniref:histidine kinase n=1 Tax=Tistlia consotensis USBA 355 TaxID=560819 RepID=A0A1Y6BII3_9PROT|nr:PAS-domain containing protein [Tistlia consotensis]SMF13109.1 Signal transduction histidine kinase [Tistlia consotensis USBA 355]SNR50718.1 Signal transduction histidine kinase [Tistlia consotensis]